jgi:hypothetical protein
MFRADPATVLIRSARHLRKINRNFDERRQIRQRWDLLTKQSSFAPVLAAWVGPADRARAAASGLA